MSGWEPYIQVLHANTFGVVAFGQQGYICEMGFSSDYGLDHDDVPSFADVRTCAATHAAGGHGEIEIIWTGACPSTIPNGTWGGFFPARAGAHPYVAYYVFQSKYFLDFYQGEAWLTANRTITAHGMESWADPTVNPGPATEVIGGRTVHWSYAPFTQLYGSIRFGDATTPGFVSHGVAYGGPFTVHAKEVPFGTSATWTGWDAADSGTTRFSLSVGSGVVAAVGQQELPDLMSPRRWRIAASNAQAGVDPGRPTPGMEDVDSWASYVLYPTIYRVGQRRAGLAPPLHQRRRTDGLGGGPSLQGQGLASRQRGGRARSIY